MGARTVFEKVGLELKHAAEVKRSDVEQLGHGHDRVLARHDWCELVDVAQAARDLGERRLVDKVRLVEQQLVGERDLLDALVLGALGLLLVKVLGGG